jgi:hypothetical protein
MTSYLFGPRTNTAALIPNVITINGSEGFSAAPTD